jgi:hypothetical protein
VKGEAKMETIISNLLLARGHKLRRNIKVNRIKGKFSKLVEYKPW